jgi:endonuclease YncB( thermonuclease family)
MFRIISGFALILLALAWLAPQGQAPTVGVVQASGGLASAGLQGRARVIDGDTFVVNGVTIRLQGVDAPESSARCRDARGQGFACGDWATARTRELIGNRPLDCRDLGERTHGRMVAQCLLGGQDLAAQLIAQGIVLACPRFARTHPHSAGYERIEAQAIAARIGLHAGQTPQRAGFCQVSGPARTTGVSDTGGTSGCRIKGNISRSGERIYHMPGQRDYERTQINTAQGERWFCSEAEARAAGWRRANR